MKNESEIFELLIERAKEAALQDEIPIAAAIVKNGLIISCFANQTESKNSFLAHAEMLCFEEAAKKIGSKYLVDCDLYCSLEPCQMCLNAARLCRIRSIKYLVESPKFGEGGYGYGHIDVQPVQIPDYKKSILDMMQSFFEKKR